MFFFQMDFLEKWEVYNKMLTNSFLGSQTFLETD